jgi:hypothetical protein
MENNNQNNDNTNINPDEIFGQTNNVNENKEQINLNQNTNINNLAQDAVNILGQQNTNDLSENNVQTLQPTIEPANMAMDQSPITDINMNQQNNDASQINQPTMQPANMAMDQSPITDINMNQQNNDASQINQPTMQPANMAMDQSPITDINMNQQNNDASQINQPTMQPANMAMDQSPITDINMNQQNNDASQINQPTMQPANMATDQSPITDINMNQQNNDASQINQPTMQPTNLNQDTVLISNSVDQTNNNNLNQTNEQNVQSTIKPANKSKKIFTIIIILAIVLAGLFAFYKFYLTTPKNIISTNLDGAYKVMNNFIDKKTSILDFSNPVLITSDETINTDFSSLASLSKIKFSTTTGIDLNNEKIYTKSNISESDKNILTIDSLMTKDNIYLNLNSLFSQIIKSENPEGNIFDTLKNSIKNVDESKNVIKEMEQILKKEYAQLNYKESTEKIAINDKDYSLNTLTAELSADDYYNLMINIINDIINNNNLITSVANISGKTNSEILDSLSKSKESLSKDSFDAINIKFYTNGILKNIVGLKTEASGYNIDIIDINGNGYFKIYNDNKDVININITNHNDLVVKINDGIINIKINSLTDSVIDFNYSTVIQNVTYSGNINLTSDSNNYKFLITFSNGTNSFSLTGNTTITYNATMPTFDTTNTIDESNLTSSQLYSIYYALYNKLLGTGLDSIFNPYIKGMMDTYQYSSYYYSSYNNSYSYSNSINNQQY